MTTFQAIIYSIVHGFTEFLPLSLSGHHYLLKTVLDWPEPDSIYLGAISLGSLLAVLIRYRHDWASIVSSFLQVILFRKKPMTLDERLLFFIAITTAPILAVWNQLYPRIVAIEITPLWVVISMIGFSLPILLSESLNRRTKNTADWNSLDALLVGIAQIVLLVPGASRQSAFLATSFFRNYNRDAAIKYSFLSLMPLLIIKTTHHLSQYTGDYSRFTFSTALIVAFFSSLLAMGGLTKSLQSRGMGGYVIYTLLLALGSGIYFWVKTP